MAQCVGVTGCSLEGSLDLFGIVDEVAAGAVGAAALEVEFVAELRLVLGVATGLAQLPQAVGKLALGPITTAPAL